MKVAIIGSRNVPSYAPRLVLSEIPTDVTEIVSGGAEGIDRIAAQCAEALSVPLREFLPDYETYGKRAPLERNKLIVDHADRVLAFWDGKSRGTQQAIAYCIKIGKPVRIIPLYQQEL